MIARCGTSAATTTVTVVKVDIKPSETNVCSCPTSVLLELSEDSYPGNGTIWSSSPEGLGGVQTTDTTYMFNPSISTPGEYEVKAASVDFPECEDVCTVRIVKISFNEIPAIRYNRVYREDVHPVNNNRITMTVHCKWNCARAAFVMLGKAATQDEVFAIGTTTLSQNHNRAMDGNDFINKYDLSLKTSFELRYDGIRNANALGIEPKGAFGHAHLVDGARKNINDDGTIIITGAQFHSFDPGEDTYEWRTTLNEIYIQETEE